MAKNSFVAEKTFKKRIRLAQSERKEARETINISTIVVIHYFLIGHLSDQSVTDS